MTAFSTAAAALLGDLNLGVDALYRPGGGGPGVGIRVIRERPTAETQAFGAKLRAGAELLHLRVADAPALAKGDTVTIGTETLTVQGAPRRDTLGLLWTAEC